MRLVVFALASPTFDLALAETTAQQATAALVAAGSELVGDATLLADEASLDARIALVEDAGANAVIILQTSYTDALLAKRIAQATALPLIVWAFPEPRTGGKLRLNSFCGLNLAANALGRIGRAPDYIYAPADQPPDVARLLSRQVPHPAWQVASDPEPDLARHALDDVSGVYGLIGTPPERLDTGAFDPSTLRRLFGISVAQMSSQSVFGAAESADAARVDRLYADTAAKLGGVDDLDTDEVRKALGAYTALADTVRSGELKGVAGHCESEAQADHGGGVGGAIAQLNDEMTPGNCEADMLAAIGSRLLQALAQAPSLLFDLVDMDDASDTSVVWHCGLAPLAMRDPGDAVAAAVRANSDKPLLRQFALKPGPVTIARLSQAGGTLKLVIASGQMLKAPRPFAGTAGTLRLTAGTGPCRDTIIGEGIEHQLSLVYGEVKEGLLSVASQLGLPVLDLDQAG